MIQVCKYSPSRDLQKVDITGLFDLTAAYAAGSIPANMPLAEERFNGIEDPNSIGGRPRDNFEAAQAAVAITSYKAPKQDAE